MKRTSAETADTWKSSRRANIRRGRRFNSVTFAAQTAVIAVVVSAATLPADAQFTYETVALARAGDNHPKGPSLGPGIHFDAFCGCAVINQNGVVAFRGVLSGILSEPGKEIGLWVGEPGSVALVARRGETAVYGPGIAGAHFDTFDFPVLNEAGIIAFKARLAGPGVTASNDSGYWVQVPDGISVRAREGVGGPLGPGIAAGPLVDATFGEFRSQPALGRFGRIAFVGDLMGDRVIDTSDSGIWSATADRAGPPLAGEEDVGPHPGQNMGPVEFDRFENQPVMNPAGTIAFSSRMRFLVSPNVDSGIWLVGGAYELPTIIAREGVDGELAPNLGAGVQFSEFALSRPVINRRAEVATAGLLQGTGVDFTNSEAILVWAEPAGQEARKWTVAARTGAVGPGPGLGTGIEFDAFEHPSIDDKGGVAFRARVRGEGVTVSNREGLWAGRLDNLKPVAREGTTGDLGPPKPEIDPPTPRVVTFFHLSPPVLNARGDLAFIGVLEGDGVSLQNDEGIWAALRTSDGGYKLYQIAREGDYFDVDDRIDTDFRQIADLSLANPLLGLGGGLYSSFSGNGKLVFELRFTDGTAGVFTTDLPVRPIPEGSTLLLGAMASAGLLLRRRALG